MFIAVYTFLCVAAIFLFIRGMGAITGLILGTKGVIAVALSQLANARINAPVWIPLCGALAVSYFRALLFNHPFRCAAMVTVVSVIILLFIFIVAFLLTKVNGVFVHVAIGIIRMLLESGAF